MVKQISYAYPKLVLTILSISVCLWTNFGLCVSHFMEPMEINRLVKIYEQVKQRNNTPLLFSHQA
jgi:hypothetical protein